MKRLALSLLGGFAIPFLYAVIVGPLTNYIENARLRELAGYPVRWPIITLTYVFPLYSFPELFLLLFIVVPNVLLYSMVTYIVLWRFWKQKPGQLELPPEPPRFV